MSKNELPCPNACNCEAARTEEGANDRAACPATLKEYGKPDCVGQNLRIIRRATTDTKGAGPEPQGRETVRLCAEKINQSADHLAGIAIKCQGCEVYGSRPMRFACRTFHRGDLTECQWRKKSVRRPDKIIKEAEEIVRLAYTDLENDGSWAPEKMSGRWHIPEAPDRCETCGQDCEERTNYALYVASFDELADDPDKTAEVMSTYWGKNCQPRLRGLKKKEAKCAKESN